MTDKIQITFKDSDVTAEWDGSHDNILDFAESLDLMPAFSCRDGYCHTCQCTLVSGEVEYNDPDAMTPDEPGQTLICCTRPKTSVVLDI